MTDEKTDIARRKSDHIDIVLEQEVGFARLTTGFEAYRFVHCALPEISLEEVDLTASLFGRPLKAPFLISSMTGGPAHAETINAHLAEAAEELGLALAVGSQRIALEEQGSGGMTKELRKKAPSIALIGNLGAAQILGPEGLDRARRSIDMIEADGLFIHLNPLQEAIQPGGDRDWRGVLQAIATLCDEGLPIAVKEVGFGLSAQLVRQLMDVGVQTIDVAGAGGTNWARVEGHRGKAAYALAEAFTEWGIPTAKAVIEARAAAPGVRLIASGGIKGGIDAAKALRLGADIVGQAAATLGPAIDGPEAVIHHFRELTEVLSIACFVTGSVNIDALKKAPMEGLSDLNRP
ncbi:MAG: type 2 isopentenyl-diphosphate Delta-isomerase [Pseudomonadota bacterium]